MTLGTVIWDYRSHSKCQNVTSFLPKFAAKILRIHQTTLRCCWAPAEVESALYTVQRPQISCRIAYQDHLRGNQSTEHPSSTFQKAGKRATKPRYRRRTTWGGFAGGPFCKEWRPPNGSEVMEMKQLKSPNPVARCLQRTSQSLCAQRMNQTQKSQKMTQYLELEMSNQRRQTHWPLKYCSKKRRQEFPFD